MEKNSENKSNKRREFIKSSARLTLALGLGGVGGLALNASTREEWVSIPQNVIIAVLLGYLAYARMRLSPLPERSRAAT